METLLQDLRYGLRMMVRNRGFVTVAVTSLALGICANTMIFSLVNALLLRPLSVDEPDQLVRIFRVDENGPYHSLSYPDYVDYRDRQQSFFGIAAGQRMMMSLSVGGRPEAILGAVVSDNFFSVLGTQPMLGRAFAPEEDRTPGGHPVAVISHSLWLRRFNADPDLIGKTVKLNGRGFTVIGIAAKGFTGIDNVFATEVWVPIMMYPTLISRGRLAFDPAHGREETWLNDVFGRLKPGVGIEQAQSDMSGISAQLESAYPGARDNQRRGIVLTALGQGDPEMRTAILSFLSLLMGGAGLVLLIACANVANLLLTRAAARQREVAIRLAMGASRWRLIRQLLTESVTLALAGGAIGLLLTFWGNNLLLFFKPSIPIPVSIDLSLDQRVLGFNLIVSFLTGIAFGFAPAVQASRSDLAPALKARSVSFGHGYWGARLHSLLVIVQMALSLVLLIGATLLLRSARNAYRTDPGFERQNLVLLSTDLDLRGYEPDQGRQFYRRLLDSARSVPGVRSASLTSLFPLSLGLSEAMVAAEGRASQPESREASVGVTDVAPGYFVTMGIPLIQGREFSPYDTEANSKVAIINRAMASRFWPGENALGKRIRVDPLDPQGHYYEVIGVVKDSAFGSLGEAPRPFMHRCIYQEYSSSLTLVARIESTPGRVLAALRREVQSLDDALPVYDVETITEHLNLTLFPLRMATTLLGALGGVALLLASVGLYAVIAYAVTLRTRDYGIRMALGAQPIQVLRQVLTRGIGLATVGIGIGLALALVMSRAMSTLGLLHDIGIIDPAAFIGVPWALGLVAALASYLPARRATKIDPVIALRQE